MKIRELIEMLERAEKEVDGDQVEVILHTGHWTTEGIVSLKIEDVGCSYGPDGQSVYIDVLLDAKDFVYADKGIQDFKDYYGEDD